MRALNIVYFIAFVSIAVGVVNAVLASGLPGAGSVNYSVVNASQWNLTAPDTELRADVSMSFTDIIMGALQLGSTIQSLAPFPLPGILVDGLDAMSALAVSLAIIQFVWRLVLAGGE